MLKNIKEQQSKNRQNMSYYSRGLLSRSIKPFPLFLRFLLTFIQFFLISCIIIFPNGYASSLNNSKTYGNVVLGQKNLYLIEYKGKVQNIQIFLLSLIGAVMLLNLLILKGGVENKKICKLSIILTYIYIWIAVPLNHIVFLRLKRIKLGETSATQIILYISQLLMTLIANGIGYFHIKWDFIPIRNGNIYWKSDNMPEAYFFLSNIIRAYVISFDGINSHIIAWSAFCEIYRRRYYILRKQPSMKLQRIILENRSNLLLAVHCGIFLDFILGKQQVKLDIWLVLIFGCIVTNILQCLSCRFDITSIPGCNQQIYEHYNCYFAIEEEVLSDYKKQKNRIINLINFHNYICKSANCFIKKQNYKQETADLKGIKAALQEIILSKDQSIKDKFYRQLWLCEVGKSYSFQHFDSLSQQKQYASTYLLNLKNMAEIKQEVTEENGQKMVDNFYEQMEYISNQFGIFYFEISKAKPRLDTVLNTGIAIQNSVKRLKDKFNIMLINDQLNLRLINIYVKFFGFFINSNEIDQNILAKIDKNQKHNIKNIHECHFPAMNISQETGIIKEVNREFIKFVNSDNYQGINIADIFIPQITVQDVLQHHQKNPLELYNIFLKKQTNSFLQKSAEDKLRFVSLVIKLRDIQGQKTVVIGIQIKQYHPNISYLLLDSQQNIKCMTLQQITYMKDKSNQINIINLRQIIERQKQFLTKQLQNQINLFMPIHSHPNTKLNIKVVNKVKNHIIMWVKMSKFVVDENQQVKQPLKQRKGILQYKFESFVFGYDNQGQNELILNGRLLKRSQTYKKKKISNTMFNSLLSNTLMKQIVEKVNFGIDIKTYRLLDKDIYNIDLEDKEGCILEFTKYQHQKVIQSPDYYKSKADLYSLLSLLVSILMVFIGVGLIFYEDSKKMISSPLIKANRIERFQINLMRIASIMRDVEYYQLVGKDWASDIEEAYRNITQEKINIFNREKQQIKLNNLNYYTNLNQGGQIVLTYVYNLIKEKKKDNIPDLHRSIILQYIQKITEEQDEIYRDLSQKMSDFREVKRNWMIALMVATSLYYIFLANACMKITDEVKEEMSSLMMMSDKSAIYHMQYAYYFKDMAKNIKLIDNEENLIEEKHDFTLRKKKKKTIIGDRLKQNTRISGVITFCANFYLLYFFYLQCVNQFDKTQNFIEQSQAISGLYHEFGEISNQIYLGKLPQNHQFQKVYSQTNIINSGQVRKKQLFSIQITKEVQRVFFSTCLENTLKNCNNSIPNFHVSNPFQVGLNLYFIQMVYELRNNVSQTFGFTGIYSKEFSKVFINITKNLEQESLIFEQKNNKLVLMINIFYLLFALLAITHLKSRVDIVRSLVKFLNKEKKNSQSQSQNENSLSKNSISRKTIKKLQDQSSHWINPQPIKDQSSKHKII